MVTRGDVFPEIHGAAAKIVSTARYLGRVGVETYLITTDDTGYLRFRDAEPELMRYPFWMRFYPKNQFLANAVLSYYRIPFHDRLIYMPLFDLNLFVKALYVAAREKLDLLQAEFTAFAAPVLFAAGLLGIKSSLVEHNIECHRLKEQGSLDEKGERFAVAVEKAMCKKVNHLITVSQADKQRLMELGIEQGKIAIIPHGVALERYQSLTPQRVRELLNIDSPIIVFHGDYTYAPNLAALKEIIFQIIPFIKQAGHGVKALLVGRNFPPYLVNNDDCIFTGAVADLPSHLSAADVAVVPIRSGGGTRLKIFEYLAARVPIVSTAKGIEGIELTHGENVLIAETPEDMAQAVCKLIEDPKLAGQLAANGWEFVQGYDWERIALRYKELYFAIK